MSDTEEGGGRRKGDRELEKVRVGQRQRDKRGGGDKEMQKVSVRERYCYIGVGYTIRG